MRAKSEQLFEIAEGQQGYFTTAQATAAGYARSTHSYNVQERNWVREYRGIYRLRQFPQSEDSQLVLWSLWTRDLKGQSQGVYSHLTALSLLDLSDANPSRLDMTVPPSFRRRSRIPKVLRLHKADLSPQEIVARRGYSITKAMRAITDLSMSGKVDRDLIEQALGEGKARGLITRREISHDRMRPDLPEWYRHTLSRHS